MCNHTFVLSSWLSLVVTNWAGEPQWACGITSTVCVSPIELQGIGLRQRLGHWLVRSGRPPGANWPVRKGQMWREAYQKNTSPLSSNKVQADSNHQLMSNALAGADALLIDWCQVVGLLGLIGLSKQAKNTRRLTTNTQIHTQALSLVIEDKEAPWCLAPLKRKEPVLMVIVFYDGKYHHHFV